MSSLIKGVRGGTLSPNAEPLCRTCRNARYVSGSAENQRLLICTEVSYAVKGPMPFEALECSDYDDKRRATKGEMELTAWILRTDPKAKGQWGFVSPEQRKKERKEQGGGLPEWLDDEVANTP